VAPERITDNLDGIELWKGAAEVCALHESREMEIFRITTRERLSTFQS
jgi:hypothetical protein